MENTLDQALDRLFGVSQRSPVVPPPALLADAAPTANLAEALPVAALQTSSYSALASRAQDHYALALEAQREGDWTQYGEEIEQLGEVLEELQEGASQN